MIKRATIAFLLSLSIFATPPVSHAASLDALFKQLQAAKQLLEIIQQQIHTLTQSTTTSPQTTDPDTFASTTPQTHSTSTLQCPELPSQSLYFGVSSPFVTNVQRFLKALDLFDYPTFTTYFGPKTKEAVQRFQCQYMQLCGGRGYGVVGPKTKQTIRTVCSKQTTSTVASETLNILEEIIPPLQRGDHGPSVALLQKLLIQTGDLDIDQPTGYFGPKTESALQTLQCRVLKRCAGFPFTNGFGLFDEETKRALEHVLVQQKQQDTQEQALEEEKQQRNFFSWGWGYDKPDTPDEPDEPRDCPDISKEHTEGELCTLPDGRQGHWRYQTPSAACAYWECVVQDRKTQNKYKDFIKAAYQLILDREPSEDTIAKYTEEFKFENKHWGGYDNAYDPNTAVALHMIWSMFNSKEFKNRHGDINTLSDKEVVKLFYKTILNREPNKTGLDTYLQMLKDGWHRREIMRRILMSKESQKKNPELFAEDILKETYRDVNTAGPYIGKNFDASKLTSFSSDEKLVIAHFAYWYDKYTGQHLFQPLDFEKKVPDHLKNKLRYITVDGKKYIDVITTHPSTYPNYDNPPESMKSKEWWKKEIKDTIEAGIDILFLMYWGQPVLDNKDNRGHNILEPFNQAMRELEAEGYKVPKVAIQLETTPYDRGRNKYFKQFDLNKVLHQEYLYRSIRDFYSRIDPKYWTLFDGKVVVSIWKPEPSFKKGYSLKTFKHIAKRFAEDFGGSEIHWVFQGVKNTETNRYIQWDKDKVPAGSDFLLWASETAPDGVWITGNFASIVPGFDNSNTQVVLIGKRQPRYRDRENGSLYKRAWQAVLNDPQVTKVYIASWNAYPEGHDINETYEYGRQYINLTREFVDKWKNPGKKDVDAKYKDFIKAAYQLILDREPSEDTIAKYTEEFKFENKHWGGYDNAYDPNTAVALSLIWKLFNSKTFKNKYNADINTVSDKDAIKLFYKAILKREPTQNELNKYLKMLQNGWHEREVMRRILMSKESRNKNTALFKDKILKETLNVNTAGPYIGKNFDASKLTSFSSDDKLVMTYFFTWYDVYSGEHVYTDLDKVLPQYRDKVAFTYNGKKVASIMTTHPSTHPHYNNPPFTVKSKEWWKKELKDMHDAGVDIAILSGLWHFPAKHTKGNRTALLLEPLNQALRELDREGVHMKVAMQWSTGKAGKNNIFFRDFDLTKKPQQEFFYKSIRDFYSRIDPKFWALIDGKVVVNTWIPKYFSNYDQEVFNYSEKQFAKDFGGKKIWWIFGNSRLYSKSIVWKASVLPKADRSFWGAHTSPHAAWFSDKVVQVSPGFDKSHAATVLTGAIKPPRIIPRQNGNFYRKGWEKIFKNKKVRRVMIETWNEYHEGRDISDSYEYGRRYINLTREFVDKWKKK